MKILLDTSLRELVLREGPSWEKVSGDGMCIICIILVWHSKGENIIITKITIITIMMMMIWIITIVKVVLVKVDSFDKISLRVRLEARYSFVTELTKTNGITSSLKKNIQNERGNEGRKCEWGSSDKEANLRISIEVSHGYACNQSLSYFYYLLLFGCWN